METIIKQAREVGTSAGVLVPRKWLNRQVVVTLFSPSKEQIALDIFDILLKKNLNEEIKGIYLYGSYARGDYDAQSDIDVLVITQKTSKLINHENYEITLIPEQNFSKNVRESIHYLSILKEMKVLINKELIEKYSVEKSRIHIKKNLKEIGSILKINRDTAELCEEDNENIPDGIVYSIVLRLRELFLIRCLLSDTMYYKKDFLKVVPEKIYSAYARVKRDQKDLEIITSKEIMPLITISEKWLKELKEQKKE